MILLTLSSCSYSPLAKKTSGELSSLYYLPTSYLTINCYTLLLKTNIKYKGNSEDDINCMQRFGKFKASHNGCK